MIRVATHSQDSEYRYCSNSQSTEAHNAMDSCKMMRTNYNLNHRGAIVTVYRSKLRSCQVLKLGVHWIHGVKILQKPITGTSSPSRLQADYNHSK